jgi:hypothetical protein
MACVSHSLLVDALLCCDVVSAVTLQFKRNTHITSTERITYLRSDAVSWYVTGGCFEHSGECSVVVSQREDSGESDPALLRNTIRSLTAELLARWGGGCDALCDVCR